MTKRRIALSVAISVAVSLLLSLGCARLGLGGYQNGRLLVAAVVGLGTTSAFWASASRSGLDPRIWTVSVALLAITLGSLVGANAPRSRGSLRSELDGYLLPFFTDLGDRATGHSWCRPTCPAVERRYRAPRTNPDVALDTVTAALVAAKVEARNVSRSATADRATLSVRTPTYRMLARAELRPGPKQGAVEDVLEVRITLSSR